jgi:hypothetical protein
LLRGLGLLARLLLPVEVSEHRRHVLLVLLGQVLLPIEQDL